MQTPAPVAPARLHRHIRLHLIDIDSELDPVELRSLDALHLATILSLGDDAERVYCYDSRLTSAARSLGLEVAEPRSERVAPRTR